MYELLQPDATSMITILYEFRHILCISSDFLIYRWKFLQNSIFVFK